MLFPFLATAQIILQTGRKTLRLAVVFALPPLDLRGFLNIFIFSVQLSVGGVLVSTWKMRWRRHAEDGSLAS